LSNITASITKKTPNIINPPIPINIQPYQLGSPCQQAISTLQNWKMNLSQNALIFLPFRLGMMNID
jgi:hypothetical protein